MIDFNASSLPALAKQLESKHSGLKVTAIEGDAADEKVIAAVCQQAITEEGRLDAFFANAGVVGLNMLQTTEPNEYMEVMRVNSLSCFLAIKHASEAMKVVQKDGDKTESGGSIILTASGEFESPSAFARLAMLMPLHYSRGYEVGSWTYGLLVSSCGSSFISRADFGPPPQRLQVLGDQPRQHWRSDSAGHRHSSQRCTPWSDRDGHDNLHVSSVGESKSRR